MAFFLALPDLGRILNVFVLNRPVPAANLGPTPTILMADWMRATLDGKPFPSEKWFVESTGRIVKTPL